MTSAGSANQTRGRLDLAVTAWCFDDRLGRARYVCAAHQRCPVARRPPIADGPAEVLLASVAVQAATPGAPSARLAKLSPPQAARRQEQSFGPSGRAPNGAARAPCRLFGGCAPPA